MAWSGRECWIILKVTEMAGNSLSWLEYAFQHSSSCQILVPTLPTTHLNCQQFGWRFRCAMLIVATLALSPQPQAERRSGHQRSTVHTLKRVSFSDLSSAPTETDSSDIAGATEGFIQLFFAYAIMLSNTCKKTLKWQMFHSPLTVLSIVGNCGTLITNWTSQTNCFLLGNEWVSVTVKMFREKGVCQSHRALPFNMCVFNISVWYSNSTVANSWLGFDTSTLNLNERLTDNTTQHL